MNYLHTLNNHELKAIIECQSQNEVMELIGHNEVKLLEQIPHYDLLKKNIHYSSKPFVEALELAQIPIDILWITVSFISLELATLWVL